MVGILEGLAPLPGLLGVSEASEQTERESWSSDASEASLPRRLLALLPAWLPARLVGPLTEDPPRFGSVEMKSKSGRGFLFIWKLEGVDTEILRRETLPTVLPVRDGLLVGAEPPFSPVSEPRLEWSGGLFSLDPDAAPCRKTESQPIGPPPTARPHGSNTRPKPGQWSGTQTHQNH